MNERNEAGLSAEDLKLLTLNQLVALVLKMQSEAGEKDATVTKCAEDQTALVLRAEAAEEKVAAQVNVENTLRQQVADAEAANEKLRAAVTESNGALNEAIAKFDELAKKAGTTAVSDLQDAESIIEAWYVEHIATPLHASHPLDHLRAAVDTLKTKLGL